MTLAALGWGVWWTGLLVARLAPELAASLVPDWLPGRLLVALLAELFAVPGLFLAIWTFRAQRSWLPFTAIAVFANLSLVLLPWLAAGVEPPH